MSYGLRVRDIYGGVVFGTQERITRFIWESGILNSVHGGDSQELPQLQGLLSAQFAYQLSAAFDIATVTRAGNTISWSVTSAWGYFNYAIIVFAYT